MERMRPSHGINKRARELAERTNTSDEIPMLKRSRVVGYNIVSVKKAGKGSTDERAVDSAHGGGMKITQAQEARVYYAKPCCE
eukprot:7381775-Prymnesium_polylepis.1